MTKNRTSRTNNSFVANNEPSEELILADLDLMREDWELAPVSLTDAMDDHQVVANEEFVMPVDYDPMASGSTSFDNTSHHAISAEDLDDKEKLNITKSDVLDQIKFTEDLNTLDETVIEPINIDITTTEISTPSIIENIEIPSHEPSLIAIDISLADDLSELINIDIEKEPTLISEQTSASSKVDMTDEESKVKKARLISYAALGLSVSALVAMSFLSILVFNTKISNAKLTDLVSILQEDVKDLTIKYEGLENSSKDASIDSINPQALENTIEATNPVAAPTKNKIIHTVVKSLPLKKVDLQSHPIKHSSMVLDGNKKNKAH